MSLDREKIRVFWQNRAAKRLGEESYRITNLEEDDQLQQLKMEHEQRRVLEFLELTPGMIALDLAAGVGRWSLLLAERCRQVVAVEYLDSMVEGARAKARERGIGNIEFICQDVLDYRPKRRFDIVFISGLLLYLPDHEGARLARNIADYCDDGAVLFLREPAGAPVRHEIVDQYSEALQANYSALYRTRDEYLEMFARVGFELIRDEDMFEEGSPMNRWKETRLRLWLFQRRDQ